MSKKEELLTVDFLNEFLRYDDGFLYWIKQPNRTGHQVIIGAVAGSFTVKLDIEYFHLKEQLICYTELYFL